MTVKEIREAIEGMPDDLVVEITVTGVNAIGEATKERSPFSSFPDVPAYETGSTRIYGGLLHDYVSITVDLDIIDDEDEEILGGLTTEDSEESEESDG